MVFFEFSLDFQSENGFELTKDRKIFVLRVLTPSSDNCPHTVNKPSVKLTAVKNLNRGP